MQLWGLLNNQLNLKQVNAIKQDLVSTKNEVKDKNQIKDFNNDIVIRSNIQTVEIDGDYIYKRPINPSKIRVNLFMKS